MSDTLTKRRDPDATEERRAATFSIVCFSSQDWTVDLPTNRQQIMSRAAGRGHRVLFVETGGFVGTHVLRSFRRNGLSMARRLFGVERVAEGIGVTKALNVLPWGQKYPIANRLNNFVTRRRIGRLAHRLPAPQVSWLYDPSAARAALGLGVLVAYDCVDDYPEQAPDARRRALVAEEDRRAASTADVVFATTRTLAARHGAVNPHTHLVTNVGDFDHFSSGADRSASAPEVAGLAQPVLGFAGNFLSTKVDFDLLGTLADALPEATVLLVGPAHADTRAVLAQLDSRPNVRWIGPRAYPELPRYIAAFDVGLIPYVTNEYTRSCFPLKLYEYLAAGKPVVASGLPELADMEPDVVLASSASAFVEAVSAALELSSPHDRSRRMSLAARNTWETRTEKLLDLVERRLVALDPE